MKKSVEPKRKRTPARYCIPDPSVAVTDTVIRAHIEPGSRVIDLGCADGRLLELLRDEHGCDVLGAELDEELIVGAIARGVPVIQSDLDHGLPDLPDGSFDFAVLSQTLQQLRRPQDVLREMLRVARRALVVVPNFGHWRVRLQLVTQGRAPVTSTLPYEWYDTPNLHVMSMHDFRELAEKLRCRIVRELPIIKGRAVDRAWAANLRAESVLYVLERH
ncbi:MAG TPA: methionine biosynthesis protein MetW [Planctomycetaceae bacterium]|nr:methionine biosynthesis protein MetW [Planctomycetaceae bacterium]